MSPTPHQRHAPSIADARGFNLLEVMIALGILAFLMSAVTSTQGASLLHGARVRNLTIATQLMDGVILDIEEEYRLDGFPDNSKESSDCELPPGFNGFDCEYDLIGLDVGADNVGALGEEAMNAVQKSPLMAALFSGGASGNDLQTDVGRVIADMGDDGRKALGALAVLSDPAMIDLCGIRIDLMAQRMPLIVSFVPTIVEQAAQATRKLVVRIAWDERGQARKTLEMETFITAVPEAEEVAP